MRYQNFTESLQHIINKTLEKQESIKTDIICWQEILAIQII